MIYQKLQQHADGLYFHYTLLEIPFIRYKGIKSSITGCLAQVRDSEA